MVFFQSGVYDTCEPLFVVVLMEAEEILDLWVECWRDTWPARERSQVSLYFLPAPVIT